MTAVAFRPYLPTDLKRCLAIFRDSIDEAASEDYDEDQRAAWKARADDETAFAAQLAGALTLIATIGGESVGFASLKGADVLDMLYVDPEHSRRGVGAALIDALSRLAQARGAAAISSEVSDTAQALFQRQGFAAQRRNLVPLGDEWLANTTMTKALSKAPSPPAATTRH